MAIAMAVSIGCYTLGYSLIIPDIPEHMDASACPRQPSAGLRLAV